MGNSDVPAGSNQPRQVDRCCTDVLSTGEPASRSRSAPADRFSSACSAIVSGSRGMSKRRQPNVAVSIDEARHDPPTRNHRLRQTRRRGEREPATENPGIPLDLIGKEHPPAGVMSAPAESIGGHTPGLGPRLPWPSVRRRERRSGQSVALLVD